MLACRIPLTIAVVIQGCTTASWFHLSHKKNGIKCVFHTDSMPGIIMKYSLLCYHYTAKKKQVCFGNEPQVTSINWSNRPKQTQKFIFHAESALPVTSQGIMLVQLGSI